MLTARTDPFLIDDPAGTDREVPAVARPLPALAPADRAARLGLSAARPGAGPALVAAILLHAALLAVVLSVGLRSPAEPLPLESVPLVFEPPAPQASADSPPAPAAPAVPTPVAAPTPLPPVAAAPTPPPPTPDAPAPDLPDMNVPDPTPPSPEAAAAAPPVVPMVAPPPPLALPVIPPPPPGPSLSAIAPLPIPPAEPEAVPRHTATRPAPRPVVRRRPESRAEARAEARPAAAAPASEAAPAAAAPAAPPGPTLPPRPVAGLAGNRRPVYPTQARDRGEEGTVLVLVHVTAQGAAESVSVARSSGHPALDEAAMAAIRSWRFSPATRGCVPVAAEAEVPVAFHLND